MGMGKRVKLLKNYVIQGTTIPANNVGEIVSYPGRDDSPMASQPEQEGGILKVRFENPTDIVIGVPIDRMTEWFADVPVDTPVTP